MSVQYDLAWLFRPKSSSTQAEATGLTQQHCYVVVSDLNLAVVAQKWRNAYKASNIK